MKKIILFLLLLCPIIGMAQEQTKVDSTMIVRISEIEVYPEYLQEYLEQAHTVGATSVREEPGVICIYPMQQLRNDCQIRILEIYASQEAYHTTLRLRISRPTSKAPSTWSRALTSWTCDRWHPNAFL